MTPVDHLYELSNFILGEPLSHEDLKRFAYSFIQISAVSNVDHAEKVFQVLLPICLTKSSPLEWLLREMNFEQQALATGLRKGTALEELEYKEGRVTDEALDLYNERMNRIMPPLD